MADAVCAIDDCEKPRHSRGWCQMHYVRWKKNGDPNIRALAPPKRRPARVGVEPCVIEGCDKVMRARGWCTAHWTRWKRHGSPTARLRGEIVDGKRICPGCKEDKPLDQYSPNSTGRCRRCAADLANERRPPWVPVEGHPLECDNCQSVFMANGRRNRYCCAECAVAHRHKANWKHVQKRRARLRNGTYEPFDRREIFERDDWICQLCDEPVDPALECPHPGSVSLDHIIPVSLGGPHTRANAQTAHLGCNVLKGNRISEAVA